jgi:hypothetical protein
MVPTGRPLFVSVSAALKEMRGVHVELGCCKFYVSVAIFNFVGSVMYNGNESIIILTY